MYVDLDFPRSGTLKRNRAGLVGDLGPDSFPIHDSELGNPHPEIERQIPINIPEKSVHFAENPTVISSQSVPFDHDQTLPPGAGNGVDFHPSDPIPGTYKQN
jgi:hypothetical protein